MGITPKTILAFLALGITQHSAAAPPSITGLGRLPGPNNDYSVATGLSDDGSTVVGYALQGYDYEVFRWTAEEGMVGLGIPARTPYDALSELFDGSIPQISSDGAIVTGGTSFESPTVETFKWTQSGGRENLGYLEGGGISTATGVSGDGSIIVGFSESETVGREAFRWTEADGMVGLGYFIGQSEFSRANGISTDGSTIVGETSLSDSSYPFRWTSDEGMVELADPAGNITGGSAYDVSPDGSVIVGHALIDSEPGFQPFRWTEGEGMVPLGNVVSGMEAGFGIAYGVSADGSAIVGTARLYDRFTAMMWDAEHGLRTVEDVLTNDYGLDLTGWHLTAAYDISPDGRTIVGYGNSPNGGTEAWIAVVPEPSTFMLAGSGIFAMTVFMRRKRNSH